MGQVIGNYEIIGELGRGGMGVVCKAVDRTLQREVAIKVLSRSLAGNPQFVARFVREARAAAQLNHPNIARIYTAGDVDGRPYIVMEYIKGNTLARVIHDSGQMEVSRALQTVREVAEALVAAHAAGIVHRDIKPANIMIDEAGHVKVMDFGLAKFQGTTTGITAAGAVLGTPLYMAPEQIQGGMVDARTDIYALGITFYEMLAGAPPFMADTPVALMYQIVHQSLPGLDTILPKRSDIRPQTVRQIMERMTAKNADDRYSSSEALLTDLASAAAGTWRGGALRRDKAPWKWRALSHKSRIRWVVVAVIVFLLAMNYEIIAVMIYAAISLVWDIFNR